MTLAALPTAHLSGSSSSREFHSVGNTVRGNFPRFRVFLGIEHSGLTGVRASLDIQVSTTILVLL